VGGRRSSAATREKTASFGIACCAQGPTLGLQDDAEGHAFFARFASTPSAAHAHSPDISPGPPFLQVLHEGETWPLTTTNLEPRKTARQTRHPCGGMQGRTLLVAKFFVSTALASARHLVDTLTDFGSGTP
jgi:hypothetical protein